MGTTGEGYQNRCLHEPGLGSTVGSFHQDVTVEQWKHPSCMELSDIFSGLRRSETANDFMDLSPDRGRAGCLGQLEGTRWTLHG